LLAKRPMDRPGHADDIADALDSIAGAGSSGGLGGRPSPQGRASRLPVLYRPDLVGRNQIIEALQRLGHYFGPRLEVECPTGSGRWMSLDGVAAELSRRLIALFLPGPDGRRPSWGGDPRLADDPRWRDLLLFHEYYDGDTGRGLGASHQTGWTALVAKLIDQQGRRGP